MVTAILKFVLPVLRSLSRATSGAALRLEWLVIHRELDEVPRLRRISAAFQRLPESRWSVAEDDLLRLYRLVRRQKPRHILEFGTGLGRSTAAMALALRENGGGRITTLEQLPRLIEVARTLIPPELQASIRFVHAAPRAFQLPQVSDWLYFCGYDWEPAADETFDFVFVDGPAGWLAGGKLVSLDPGDVFRLMPHFPPGGIIYIDGRRSTVKKLKRYLSRYLRLVEQGSEHAIFERTRLMVASLDRLEIVDAKLVAPGNPYASAG